jgi:hypothetical protein
MKFIMGYSIINKEGNTKQKQIGYGNLGDTNKILASF